MLKKRRKTFLLHLPWDRSLGPCIPSQSCLLALASSSVKWGTLVRIKGNNAQRLFRTGSGAQRTQEMFVFKTEGQAQHGDKKPLPRAQAAPAPGGTGRPRERPPEGARRSTRGARGSRLHDRPPRPAQLTAPGAVGPYTPRKATIRPVRNTRPAGPQQATGPGRQGWGAAGASTITSSVPTRDLLMGVLLL